MSGTEHESADRDAIFTDGTERPEDSLRRIARENVELQAAVERAHSLAVEWRRLADAERGRLEVMPRTEENVRPHVRFRAREEMAREHAYTLFAALDGAADPPTDGRLNL
jgi:hypothetical protein